MKKLVALFGMLAVLFSTGFAFAQAPTAEGDVATVAEAPMAEAPVLVEPEVTLDQLLDMIGKVVSDWRVIGWMAGVIALIALLIAALRFTPLNNLLEKNDLKWIKVYVSAGLGALSGFFSAFQTGAGWVQSILLGLMAGWAVIGAHQTITKGNKKKEKK